MGTVSSVALLMVPEAAEELEKGMQSVASVKKMEEPAPTKHHRRPFSPGKKK